MLQAFRAAFAAIATFLHASEGRLRNRSDKIVDRKVARFDAVSQAIHIACRMREGIGSQRVRQELAFSIASSSDFTGLIKASGPKGSSCMARASSGRSA